MKKIGKDVVGKFNVAKNLFMLVMRPTFFVATCAAVIIAGMKIVSL